MQISPGAVRDLTIKYLIAITLPITHDFYIPTDGFEKWQPE